MEPIRTDIPARLDDSLLAPFQLVDPALSKLNDDLDPFLLEYLNLDEAPPLPKLQEGFEKLKGYQVLTAKLLDQARDELERWKKESAQAQETKEEAERTRAVQEELRKELADLHDDLQTLTQDIDKARAAVREPNRKKSLEDLLKLIRREKTTVSELYVTQTQIRVFLIKLTPVNVKLDAGVAYARTHRLDLMNQKARVVDAWRQIAVTANLLRSQLTVTGTANLATPPLSLNPVGFAASANSYTVGFQFNAPLNREAERNNYRQSLINYQLLRRSYMNLDDTIQKQIRADLRRLEQDRLSFEISRRSLVAAARAVESAEDAQRLPPDAANVGATSAAANALVVLKAFDDLLAAKNSLIGIWVSYEADRIQLLLDLEALQLDEREVPANDADDQPADLLPERAPGADAVARRQIDARTQGPDGRPGRRLRRVARRFRHA